MTRIQFVKARRSGFVEASRKVSNLRQSRRLEGTDRHPLEKLRTGIGRHGKQKEALHLIKSEDPSWNFEV